LHLLAAQQHKITPPLLELQVTLAFLLRVDPNVILLGPERVGGVRDNSAEARKGMDAEKLGDGGDILGRGEAPI
jgi:hypothetical protein